MLIQELPQELARGAVHATADLAGEAPALDLMGGDQQGAEVAMAALARLVADEDQLLFPTGLDLEPPSRPPAGLIAAPPQLRHAALESLLGHGPLEVLAMLEHVADVAH